MTEARQRIASDIDAIEEAYEFFLAYAAQGITKFDPSSSLVGKLRGYLDRTAEAISTLPGHLEALLEGEELESPDEIAAFGRTLGDDARAAGTVVALVRSREAISSQLVDNLNASIHIRRLLTDLFLLDEVLKLGVDEATRPEPSETVPPS